MDSDRVHLKSIREAIIRIKHRTENGREFFFKDRMIRNAVFRELKTIGSSVKSLSRDLKSRWPDFPWSRYAEMGDSPVEDYLGADLKVVWDEFERRLNNLLKAIEEIQAKI